LGTLHYGASRTSIRIDDRALAHLQTVITTKLRRNEGLLIQWEKPVESGSGRGAFWIHPQCDLIYEYDGGREPSLDSVELDRLMVEASGTRGLRIAAEERAFA
jgi:hypothetical protein